MAIRRTATTVGKTATATPAFPQVAPEPGFPAPVQPVPGEPAPVQPVPENLAPLSIQQNHYRDPHPLPPGHCGPSPRLRLSQGRRTKITKISMPWKTSMPWSPRSAASGPSGHRDRSAGLWLTPTSPSAAGTSPGRPCSPSPPTPSRISLADWHTAARGGTSPAPAAAADPGRRGVASAATNAPARSACPTARSGAARPAIRWRGRSHDQRERGRDAGELIG